MKLSKMDKLWIQTVTTEAEILRLADMLSDYPGKQNKLQDMAYLLGEWYEAIAGDAI